MAKSLRSKFKRKMRSIARTKKTPKELALLDGAVARRTAYELQNSNPLCVVSACKKSDLCVIKNGKAECIRKHLLNQLAKKHQIHHKNKHRLNVKYEKKGSHLAHGQLGKHNCSRSELLSMGGRLLQWFTDMHGVSGGVDKSLGVHHIACRGDVAWMFEQWDGNSDGMLSKDELLPLESGTERCTSQFIDMCDDIEIDGYISIDEWCDCFSFADNHRHEPPCHKAKHSVNPHIQGVYIPYCDLEGFYRAEQCHEGQCWCVDKYGREFDKSRVQHQLPDCGQYASKLVKDDIANLKTRL
uniref:Thyroglobulin type-1 domain-containing protein n=1 Tax=Heterorhabditis bacteriophora TaxID=37862 RepID=A0A1I7XCS9_HETBA